MRWYGNLRGGNAADEGEAIMSPRITASLFGPALAFIGTAATAEENLYSANRILPGCRALVASDRKLAAEQGSCWGTGGTGSCSGPFLSGGPDIYLLSWFWAGTPA